MPQPPLKPGQLLGKYRVIRLIAMGGMGAVYEVLHTGLDRHDALKVMLPEFASQPELRGRFIREARATNRVRHPGIVQIYEISELEDGSPYFVMEYLDGETLGQRMDRLARAGKQKKSAADLAPLRQVASIISSCHAKGLIHRDLKPSNILLVKDPEVLGGERAKLLDFGIVKIQEEASAGPRPGLDMKTRAGLLLGTPEYMAPEQWNIGQPISDKVDVYAIGVMAYRILGGRLPFVADSPLAYGLLHVSKEPISLRQLAPDLPAELCTLVERMLAKDPRQRPSIVEVIGAIDRMSGRPHDLASSGAHLVIPDSFDSGAQSVPPPSSLPPPSARPPMPVPGASKRPPANRTVAMPPPPPVAASARPSRRPVAPGPRWGLRILVIALMPACALAFVLLRRSKPAVPPPAKSHKQQSALVDMSTTEEESPDASETPTPVDLAKPRELGEASGRRPAVDPTSLKPANKPRSVGMSCIVSKDLPEEQQKLLVRSFQNSGLSLIPGDRVVIVNLKGRPHVDKLPTYLLDRREVLEYSLLGLFPTGFSESVIIQCPPAE